MPSYRFAMRRASGRTRSGSAPVISCGKSSTTVIRAPSDAYTCAISMPMMPPPMTSIRPGNPCSSSAPVESMMRGSWGRKGSFAGCEPAAMMH